MSALTSEPQLLPESGWLTTGCRRHCSAALRNAPEPGRYALKEKYYEENSNF
ncbi:MAG: hypothetical protein GTO18_20240 [Anaerolineales bacterium]|nr:hypothetical protein [Anaerolineales bacterium]